MSGIDHEHWSEDLAAYMLGALEPEKAAELERHADGCERCRADLRWLTPAVDALPESVQRLQSPPELRERVMAEVRADARRQGARRGRDADPGLARRAADWLQDLGSGPMGLRPVVGFAAAVLVVAAVAGLAVGGGIGGGSDEGAGSTIVAGKAPGVTAKIVTEGGGGTLHLANVRQLPKERVLEAWVQRDGEVHPVRALFVPDREGRATTTIADMEGVETVMVTTEPPGGSKAPTSSPIVTIPVPQ
jgi:anti-sigma-K factor RskA